MNYKLLFPTYRNRYLFVKNGLEKYTPKGLFQLGLNLGTGEGDYDPMVSESCKELISCDINENDLAFARDLNKGIYNVSYQREDALKLSFPDNYFDMLISVDVMEHVGEPVQMTREIARVLKPGGFAFITFPQIHFPWTYDPVNRIAGRRLIAQGAYAFGHEYLIKGHEFRNWAEELGLDVLDEKNLSGYLAAGVEMYWTGIIQSIFKANATNEEKPMGKKGKLRPSLKEPFFVKLTDALIWIDNKIFRSRKYSVGKGFVLRKLSNSA